MATINEIKQQAAAVKNATQVGENTADRVGGALAGLADIAEQQDTELGKKFDKESIVQESGESEDKVMSQKVVSTKLIDISNSYGHTEKVSQIILVNNPARETGQDFSSGAFKGYKVDISSKY